MFGFTVPRRRSSSRLILALAIYLVVGFACADDGPETVDHEPLYRKHCAVCHGDAGDGRGRAGANFQPPATVFLGYTQSRESMVAAVTNGKPGTSMVGYARRLDPNEIVGIVDYIRSRFMAAPAVEKPISTEPSAGGQLYAAHCAVCHGDDGNTAVWARNGLQPAPRDFTSPAASEELSLERMLTSVTYGRPGTAMMSFRGRLNDDQIAEVVSYIRTTFLKSPAVPAARVAEADAIAPKERPEPVLVPGPLTAADIDPNAPLPNGLKGNATRGRVFFMRNCYACHGKKGDGKGPRAYFNRPAPRNFTSDDSRQRFNRPQLFASISRGKPGSVMPAWSTVLNDQQIADVAEFVFDAFIKAKPASEKKKIAHPLMLKR